MPTPETDFEIFLIVPPGLEAALRDETRSKGFRKAAIVKGGVTVRGGWQEVWRANLELRGATRVIARIASFRASHLSELDKRARKVAWREVLRPDRPFRVEASCKASKIYHSGAAEQRIERAIRETLGAPFDAEADVCIRARIEGDICTIGIDTSGDLLHKRGHKLAVNKAPMRETLAALFLQLCSYDGSEPVVDPMCGSGTFVIEAAEIAARLMPGRSRHFAFEELATFDETAWRCLLDAQAPMKPMVRFYGSDRDAGAIRMSSANAERSGVSGFTEFQQRPISELVVPDGAPGLVIVNPPYGDRIGDKNRLDPLYRSLGQTLKARFIGWRVGLITNETRLATATGLPFQPSIGPIAHGGLRVALYLTKRLTA
jgi:putative N6-adenine-specific DNA methylase